MSVIGFRIDGSIHKYDYNALDNKPGDGLTEAAKSALLQLARKVAYIDEHGEDYYQNLYDSFYGNFVNVINFLTGCYSSNIASTTKEGAAYTTTIYADSGYTLTGATISITMGGADVTGLYSNGTINIPNVTGDLVITVVAVSAVSSISAVYTQGGTVYDTDTLDSLKTDLVVTAHYRDSSTQTIPAADYTLSGTLTAGTSTITVSYGGKTTTFSVTVTEGGVLPAGYEEMECIVNPIGNASGPALNTGLTLSGNGDVVVDVSFMTYGGEENPYVLGCLSSTTANTIGFGISVQSTYSTVIVFPGTVVSIAPDVVRGVRHNITATITSTGATITDGTLTDSQTFTPRAHNVSPLYLFGVNKYNATDIQYPFTGRIYSCTVTEGGVTKLDLVPCKRVSDGMAGFYDLVAGTFVGAASLVAVPKNVTDTTAQIRSYNKVYTHHSGAPQFRESDTTNGCTTVLYDMNEPTTTLFPAGIIPTQGTGVIASDGASLFVYDASGEPVTYANEANRWAQSISGTMTEFSNLWTVASGYSKIAFSLDVRYLESAYMYDKTTGQIWFAGVATPYYGMSNIPGAQ